MKMNFDSDEICGWVVIVCLVIGGIGLLAALFSFYKEDMIGGGLSLTASALAFGLLANAILRD